MSIINSLMPVFFLWVPIWATHRSQISHTFWYKLRQKTLKLKTDFTNEALKATEIHVIAAKFGSDLSRIFLHNLDLYCDYHLQVHFLLLMPENTFLRDEQALLPDDVKLWLATVPYSLHHTSVSLCGSLDRMELICKPHDQCVNRYELSGVKKL